LKCQYCEKSTDLPFKCAFCGRYYCTDHRLPENHACPELWKASISQPTKKVYQPATQEETERPMSYPLTFKRAGWISRIEFFHLVGGALIVMIVGLSMNGAGLDWIFQMFIDPTNALSSSLVFAIIFMSHELAHKAIAKRYGLWAEFRLSTIGVAFTLLSIPSTLIKIVSPGAVMIAGAADRRTVGITALAGPVTSITLASFLLILSIFPVGSFAIILVRGAALGAWIALLNLIPFSIMDGAKVFWWNKTVWATSFCVSIGLTLSIIGFFSF